MHALSLSKSSLYPSACFRFCARAKEIRARAGRFVREQGNPRASREIRARAKEIRARAKEIRARAGRFALAHYINILSRYKNVLSTFGSKITPYSPPCLRTEAVARVSSSSAFSSFWKHQGFRLKARAASGKKRGGKFEKVSVFPAQKEDLMQNWSFECTKKKLWKHDLCEVDWLTPDCCCLLISLIRRKSLLSLLLRTASAARLFALLSSYRMFNWHLLRDVVMLCSLVSVSKNWNFNSSDFRGTFFFAMDSAGLFWSMFLRWMKRRKTLETQMPS